MSNFEKSKIEDITKAGEFARLIDIDIIKDIILPDFDNHNKSLAAIRNILIILRERITKLNNET